MARSRRSQSASAARVDRAGGEGGRAERVGQLLAGESLDSSGLSYDFDLHHVALVATGPAAAAEVEGRTRHSGMPRLVIRGQGSATWGWVGRRDGFEPEVLDSLLAPRPGNQTHLALGEPGRGLGGWRLSHQQARAALAVAHRGGETAVRYADVTMLASVLRDDLLATSLHRLYLEPLADGRDGGEELRRTLRAYFAADRNASEAGGALGVTRQAVGRRLRAAEEKLGRPLGSCAGDLEIALRLEELGDEPRLLSAR